MESPSGCLLHGQNPGVRNVRLWLGIVAPVMVGGAVVNVSMAEPSVNPLKQSISLLLDGPAGRLLRLALIMGGALLILYGWGLSRVHVQLLVAKSQAVSGVGLMITGFFMQHGLAPLHGIRIPSPWGYLTGIGTLHILGATIFYLALVMSAIFAAQGMGVKGAQWYSMATAIAMLGLLAVFIVTAATHGPSGLFERLVGMIALAWELWLATTAMTHQRHS
ncbi:MAG: hypothetical protein C7B45_08350 [Sulfobacillus acidophilus]|uniref:DUF998 domain-containing protein n=1 Tax=Sulfobacillus acidophilus TaxID=53633 RepID=A0A2T2WIP8_9FIRM|nr:MAG: hypothetical protein C7B45_08350 [Sulfobacillus acidophilus]